MELVIEQSGYNRVSFKCKSVQEAMNVINVILPLCDQETIIRFRIGEGKDESAV